MDFESFVDFVTDPEQTTLIMWPDQGGKFVIECGLCLERAEYEPRNCSDFQFMHDDRCTAAERRMLAGVVGDRNEALLELRWNIGWRKEAFDHLRWLIESGFCDDPDDLSDGSYSETSSESKPLNRG
jgi:hypothetical protein